jgi:starch phosphorylase
MLSHRHPLTRRDFPASLRPLTELAMNLWWSWDAEATTLMRDIDPHRWEKLGHNPVAVLLDISDAHMNRLAEDGEFAARVEAVAARFRAYMEGADTWVTRERPEAADLTIAYMSMEFGLHESLKTYSGGLGVLAGDHIRSASDLGLRFVGVSLLYRQGYFRQVIVEGQQVAAYPNARFDRLPLTKLLDDESQPITVEVPHLNHTYTAQVWELRVGRARLLLLDADHDGNSLEHRIFTAQLYGGDQRTRVAQEVLLGIGGVRALRRLGIQPDVFHMNEGHCAFAPVELVRERVLSGESFHDAAAAVKRQLVFTTHTPVPAGHDRFSWDIVNEALGGYRDRMGWPHGTLMDLGRVRPGDIHEPLCMTVLALKLSRAANGVSKLHGAVSRRMWRELYPYMAEDEVPIGHITTGVHPIFWMAPETRAFYDEHLPGWRRSLLERAFWEEGAARLPDEALWDLNKVLRQKLVDAVRRYTTNRALDPETLTIGFARRFAPYKRANLIFSDPERLTAMMNGEHRFQLLYAGKAHPQDLHGQALVADVLAWAAKGRFRGSVAFLEDYSIHLGGVMTQGVDIWLNNPRRPREASGTSGQKVPLNGGINLSVLDGWWPEAYDGTNGWSVGEARSYESQEAQDAADAEDLYRVLQEEVLPAFYDRDSKGIPRAWVARVKRSIATCVPVFNTHRMVRDYVDQLYLG